MVFRSKHLSNPLISYYNINSLRNKFFEIKYLASNILPDILILAETKIDNLFKDSEFTLDGYYRPQRKDFSSNSGGLIQYVRNGIIYSLKPEFELNNFESISTELTFNKQKWLLLSFYRTERNQSKKENIANFFQQLNDSVARISLKYENFILMGDINIDLKDPKAVGFVKLNDFMDLYNLKNIVKDKTCFHKGHESLIDLILTNKPLKFMSTKCYELGISDCHKLISTCLRQKVARLKPRKITYRSMKNYDKNQFKSDFERKLSNLNFSSANQAYDSIVSILKLLLDKHAPIKSKLARGNQGNFVNKSLSKAFMKRSYLKSKYLKNKSVENRALFKKQRNHCTYLKREAINSKFVNATENSNKHDTKPIYKLLKPFMTNKGALSSDDIILFENGEFINEDSRLSDIFIDLYTNIVKITTGHPPKDISSNLNDGVNVDTIVSNIIECYKNHSSVIKIFENFETKSFSFKKISIEEARNVIRTLDPKKAIGIDTISAKILKDVEAILAKPVFMIFNMMIDEDTFPSQAKIASILPLYKDKGERSDKTNYRPLSILSALSKIFERLIHNQLASYVDEIFSPYISAYRKHHSTQHVLVRLIEEWRQGIDQGKYVGSILMDLSKAFDCIPHDLLIAKLDAYGFNKGACKLLYSYLKGRQQCVKINGTHSKFHTLLAGVPQGSILGPVLFNLFINDFYSFIHNTSPHGYADDNTLSKVDVSLDKVVGDLTKDANISIDWLTNNDMIANPSKFQAIFPTKLKNQQNISIQIKDKTISSSNEVEVLGLTIDENIKFEKYISKICQSASGQLHAIYRLNRYLKPETRTLVINSFILSNFSYCPLTWCFLSARQRSKIDKIIEKSLRVIDSDNGLSYKGLLEKYGQSSIKYRTQKVIAAEIFKTFNNMNPTYMKNIFQKQATTRVTRQAFNLKSQKYISKKYGFNSLRVLGPIIWNSIPNTIKNTKGIDMFKQKIKNWGYDNCDFFKKFDTYYNTIK